MIVEDEELIHVVILIDVSHSMHSHIANFIFSLNNFINNLQKSRNNYMITIGQFNTKLSFITEFKSLYSINNLETSDFIIDGTTALYDAICNTIKIVSRGVKVKVSKTKMFIISDGDDNASFYYSKEDAEKYINDAIKNGWDITHCHTNMALFDIPTINYDVNDINCILNIFDNLKI